MNRVKTGLAARMREAMRSFPRPFTHSALYEALGADSEAERQRIRNAISDFLRRGEISRTGSGRIRYNHGWTPAVKGSKNRRIYRAMWYGPSHWSVRDVCRLSGSSSSYVHKILARLRSAGLVERCGVRSMSPVPGQEALYRISDRDRFMREVMGNG